MNIITDKDTIVNFLRGTGTDHILRTYADLLGYNDYEMEKCHDQIQWLFPLHEPSRHADTCPVLLPSTVMEAKQYDEVLENLYTAKVRLEMFLKIGDFEDVDKQRKWCRYKNHNILRVTRVIRCLRLFDLNDDAVDFYNKSIVVADRFLSTNDTKNWWTKALARNQDHVANAETDCDDGIDWDDSNGMGDPWAPLQD